MFFVVGLGNPGSKYAGTRHNVGFEAVERLAEQLRFGAFKAWKKSLISRGTYKGHDLMLAMPQTYMNLSGDAVAAVLNYYKGDGERLLVIHDELDFDPGVIRLKWSGGHGGNNGLRSIISHVGRDFARLRVGIGKPPDRDRGADFVLSRFGGTERKLVDEALERVSEAVELMLDAGIQAAMSRFNGR